MKIFADENIYEPIMAFLKSLGHDVLSIRDAGLSGIPDVDVYQHACAERRIIITMDKDFSRTSRFPPVGCGGIVILKLYKLKVEEALELFKKYFATLKENDITNNLVIITHKGTRIRKPRE